MDTDYLTRMAYHCIICANDATDVLKSELGAVCGNYSNEDDYLKGILEYVKQIEEDPKNDWRSAFERGGNHREEGQNGNLKMKSS